MFNTENISEIWHSIRQNKIRTILAGFGVAWGILILVILLGVGQGFQNGVMKLFNAFAQKSIYVYGGATSEQYKNIKEGAKILFDETFIHTLQSRYDAIEAISPEITYPGLLVKNKDKTAHFRVSGIYEDYFKIKILKVQDKGRLFTPVDNINKRRVAVIGESVANSLFPKEDAIFNYIEISGELFQVIGILKNEDIFSAAEINSIYIPFSTFTETVTSESTFSSFSLLLNEKTNTIKFEEELKHFIAYKYQFSSSDSQALYIANFETQTSSFESLFRGLKVLIWIVGICFLLSGIVGICNVMLIVVKERTNEIGIRMAVGALPNSIVNLIITESILITTFAGFVGFLLGGGLLFIIDMLINSEEGGVLEKTELNIPVILLAICVLIIAGFIAGLFPAVKASQVAPVDAIRYENRG